MKLGTKLQILALQDRSAESGLKLIVGPRNIWHRR